MSTEFLTTTEAAAILGVTGSEVRRLLDTGKLEGVKRGRGRGGVWEISAESVERRRAKMSKNKFWMLEQNGVEMGTWIAESKEGAFQALADSIHEEYREMDAEEITEEEYHEIDRLIEEQGMSQRIALDTIREK